ncbi:HelD family protein [Nocardiopsis potens]|uniref:HelD family protein n=1 Tax=Nocardiopsis potens TaxID=1246458 RepID=UPI000348F73F|nr:AAA family ATPase [Nocardiopsis potens]
METALSSEIRTERARLDAARDALRRMREDVLTTETSLGDAVVDKYTNAVLRRSRERRAELLADLPDVPLFFGRLAFPRGRLFDGEDGGPRDGDRPDSPDLGYIGRRNVHDGTGTPVVLDWRAPVAAAFYRASPRDPMGVLARRRYGFGAGGELTAFEDEDLTAGGPGGGAEDGRGGGLLAAEIERPRTGPMRDIVATIQPEQDDLVRAPLETTLCVQGAPGTGKTAVALHRIAYLLYTERDRLNRSGVAIVGPNRSFLSYIRNVLPALGEVRVEQTTLAGLLGLGEARRTDTAEAARVKGDARMAEVIRRDLRSLLREPEQEVAVAVGARRYRVPAEDVAALFGGLAAQDLPYAAGRDLLAQRIAGAVQSAMERAGRPCDARTRARLARSREVASAVAAIWPEADPVKLVLGLLTDPDRLARAAEGLLTPEEQEAVLLPGRPRGPESARWSEADLALIDEAACLIERPGSVGHLAVDEAQDLSPMQCRALARRAGTGSATVLGDLAQATRPGAVRDWDELLDHLGRPGAERAVLDRGYRVPAQVIGFAARLLPHIAPGLGAPVSARRAPGALRLTRAAPGGLAAAAAAACADALRTEGSVGLIAADADLPDLHRALLGAGLAAALLGTDENALEAERLVCVPASLAKGLEFDTVVAAEPAAIAASAPGGPARGLRLLYVALTRAVTRLHVVHADPLPDALADPGA